MNAMDEEMLRRAWEGAEGECGGFVGCWTALGFGLTETRSADVLCSDEDTSSAALRRSSKPWKGVVMTFTGVDDKVSTHTH
jgi:hypothetical protein